MPVIQYFPYFGPNRRSDKPVIEIMLDTAPDSGQHLMPRVSEIRIILQSSGVLAVGELFPEQALPAEPLACYASLLVQTALLFQRKAGHRVNFYSVSDTSQLNRYIALLEHEHCDVGMTAVKLADEVISGNRQSLAEPFRLFCEFARERMLPRETEAVIKAARQRDIPCVQLERYPFSRDKHQAICVRSNGLLMLGHGSELHILDGTFCLDKSGERLKALLRNATQRRDLLEGLGLPLSANGDNGKDSEEIIHVYAVNGKVTAVTGSYAGQVRAIESLHTSLLDLSIAVNHEVEGFPIVVKLRVSDGSKSLAASDGHIVDFELGPNLEQLTGPQLGLDLQLLDETVTAILDWLFPGPGNARVPIIAVTGTNGKTTTTRMINQVMMVADRKPGMVTTDGIFLNGKQISNKDASSLLGHSKVLTNKDVDIAVLESHHRGIFLRGFAFRWCDVAVCLNVTDDHLDESNIRSVEEMAVVKRALLERARDAVILNADDEHCLNMLPHLAAKKTCLVSVKQNLHELSAHSSKGQLSFCVLEAVNGHDWVVIYDGKRMPVITVASMPATFDGLARFNVSNAMHAIAASYMVGIGLGDIKNGMESFTMSFENTPGRLNFFEGHPFRVLMDFAHNPDGIRQLSDFVGRMEVSGRKLLMLQARGDIEDYLVKATAAAAAGHFDHYVCRTHPLYPGTDKIRTPAMLKATLMEAGVGEQQVTTTTDPVSAVDTMLNMGAAGDLLVFAPGSGQPRIDTWNRITSFQGGNTGGG